VWHICALGGREVLADEHPKILALAQAVGRNDIGCIEAICREALESNPRDEVALMILADTYWRNQLLEKALPLVDKVLEVDANEFHAHRIGADIFADFGEHMTVYKHAKCLAIVSPAIFPPTKLASRVLAPFKGLAKARRLDEPIQQDGKDSWNSYTEWVQWSMGRILQSNALHFGMQDSDGNPPTYEAMAEALMLLEFKSIMGQTT